MLDSVILSDKTLFYGEAITRALLGVDALYRQESGDEDGLVVLDMSNGMYQPEPFSDYTSASSLWQELKRRAEELPEEDRRVYYGQLCNSTLAFIQWRQNGLPFTDQLSNFLHVPAEPVSEKTLDELRAAMHALLNKMGYNGDLASQFHFWEEKTRVPPDEVPVIMQQLLDIAWDRTEKRIHIPADKSDGMQILPVTNAAFNARCDYLERKIELNVDPVLTLPSLKHLTVHEAYPGHYVQFKLRETWHAEGTAPADGLLSVVNTASSCVFEGIADNGMLLIDWMEDDDDHIYELLGRYRSAIGTAAAWRLHALGWTEDRVTDWLLNNSLAGGEGWATGRMKFISAPARAVLIWSYWWGQASVTPVYQKVPDEKQPDFLRYLYGRMHSNATVEMFL